MKKGILQVYNPIDLSFDHGDGVYLYTEDGTRYLDFTSGIGVTCLGHSHPALVSALREQAGKLWHCSNLFKIKGQEAVAKKIVDNSFASTVFFCNSGAEAVEAGIKAMRRYFYVNGKKMSSKKIEKMLIDIKSKKGIVKFAIENKHREMTSKGLEVVKLFRKHEISVEVFTDKTFSKQLSL